MADLTQFIAAELAKRGIRVEGANSTGTNLKAWCFKGHDKKAASLSIRKSDGMFYCFGCGIKGRNWNALAALIGGKQVDEKDLPDPFELLHADLAQRIAREAAQQSLPWSLEPWGAKRWRGLSVALLRLVDAHRWYDDFMRTYRILFPIWQRKKLMGWVARRLDDRKDMKYRNSDNMPAKEILYPYDFVAEYMNTKTMVIVEGAVDALRLINYGIPALAIMGTNNYTDDNRAALLNLDVERIVICTDEDPPGINCRYKILEPSLSEWFDVEHYRAPTKKDPGNMPKRCVAELKQMVKRY